MNVKIKLAEALLRRKELSEKVNILKVFNQKHVFETKTARKHVSEGIDDIVAEVPKLTASQVTEEFDWHAKQLRLIDALIQNANWTCELTVEPSVMGTYAEHI